MKNLMYLIKRVKIIFLGVILFLYNSEVFCQDGHYWSENYGNKSMLLSGTVNASVADLGAVFYNPGRLGQIDNPAFVIDAKVYEWMTIKIEDGINDGVDLSKSNFGGAPSLAAGTFKVPFLKNHKFAYSFLTRSRTQADFFIRVEKEGDIVEAIPGNEKFNGKLNFNTTFKEEWMGLTWSPPISNKFSIGLSNFVSTINRSASLSLNMNALDENSKVASLSTDRKFGFNINGLIWKLGMAMDLSPIRLGMTVTTPRVNLKNKGSTLFEDYLIGVDTTGDGNTNDAYIFNIQNNLHTTYHTPWAIGFGAGIHFKKGVIHLSAEWYDKVPQYKIMETNPFVAQSSGDTLSFTLVDELDPVLNFGVGIELKLSDKNSFYASVSTDYSAVTTNITGFAELDKKANNSVFQADFYQFGGGFSTELKWIEVTLGATYTGASQQINRPINFPDEGDDPVFDSGNTSTLLFRQWKFILGFSIPFADKMKKSLEDETE